MEGNSSASCVIVGASHAGVNAAFQLRRQGWAGKITLIDRDSELPYHRPPLSKGFLSGEDTVDDNRLRPACSYTNEKIDFVGGKDIIAIRRTDKLLQCSDGEEIAYDKLILATGASPVWPPIPGLTGNKRVFTLRTAADAQNIQAAFSQSANQKVVVVGAGFIGLEVAASLRKLGGEITVLEREARVLARVTSSVMSTFFTEFHKRHGVKIVTDCLVTTLKGEDELEVCCANGDRYPADLVVIGVGVRANTDLARLAGLNANRGIQVNAQMQTTDPDIYAIGDCTTFIHPLYEREVQLESVQNAVDQAKIAAANICGELAAYTAVPWFWSDQFGLKLQMCGLAEGYDQLIVREESTEGHCQKSVWYFARGRLLAVDAVNHARAYMLGLKLLKDGVSPDPKKVGNAAVKLHPKTLAG